MHVTDAVQSRRSIKKFTSDPVSREQIEALLQAMTMAPNHKLTEPWRFYVLGPDARYAYGRALGARKARKIENADEASATTERVAVEHRALPAMIAVALVKNENPEMAEEDYASVMMGVENMALLAVEMGLGTHLKTGAIMSDPAARAAAGVGENERIVAVVNVGVPAETPSPKPRAAATERTTWVS